MITLADGIKLFFKEGITPTLADRPVYLLAPVIAMLPAFLAFAVIPFGPEVSFFGETTPLQLTDMPVAVLFVMAIASIGIYGIVLGGWSSNSTYSLLGGLRSSAQMISYEVGMALAIVAVVMYSDTLRMSEIVASQDKIWNVIPQFPAFVIYLICGLAETNRPPFDLPEAESELVAGYHTEYSGIKFAMFYLGEYLNTVTVAAVATTLWLGGWRGPAPDIVPWLWPLLWFLFKVLVIVYIYIWVRATLPRFRYDRLMAFGWKVLIPIGLLWVMLTGAIVVLPEEFGRDAVVTAFAIGAGVVIAIMLIWPLVARRRPEEVSTS